MIQEGIHKGAGVVSRSGVYYEPRGFVQHNNMMVFIDNVKRHGFRQDFVKRLLRHIEGNPFAEFYFISSLFRLSIDENETFPDHRLDTAAGNMRLIMGNKDV